MSSQSEQKTTLKENVHLDAERFASLAEEFLKRLGYKRGLRSTKATLEGEKYTVEVELKNKTAKVQIDTKTGEIREFEIQEKVSETGFPLSRQTLLIISGISVSLVAIIVLKFMGLF